MNRKEDAPCADPTPTTSPTPTAALLGTQSPVTVPTASIGETVPGGPSSKLYLNSQRSLAYRYGADEFELFHFAGKQAWTSSPYLEKQYNKNNPQNLPPEQWLTWWADVNLSWTEITQEKFDAMCKEKKPAAAPTPDAAATTAAPAAKPAEATPTTSESAADAIMYRASTSGATAAENLSDQPCPADAVLAIENPSSAATACSGAEKKPPTFDYAGLDKQTVTDLHLAEREYTAGKRLAEMGLRRMADGVAIAHEVLCGPVVPTWDNGNHEDGACPTLGRARNNQYSEDNFRRWCTSMGVSKSAAYRLLQVSTLFDQSSPNQQKVLAELAPSLLYAAAKPSTPAELVQAVKDGNITTHKQYQELLAQLKAKEQALAAKDNAMQQAQEKAERYHVQVNELTESLSTAHQIRDNAQSRAAKAEAERDAAKQQAAKDKRRADEAEKERDGARDALSAAKLRADKWREKAEAAQVQASAPPIEAKVIDPEEVDRLAAEKAREIAAQQNAGRREQDARDAYDAFILAARQLDAIWQALAPRIPQLAADQRRAAVEHFVQKLMHIKEEVYKCP